MWTKRYQVGHKKVAHYSMAPVLEGICGGRNALCLSSEDCKMPNIKEKNKGGLDKDV